MNACEDFLQLVIHAHVFSAAMQLLGSSIFFGASFTQELTLGLSDVSETITGCCRSRMAMTFLVVSLVAVAVNVIIICTCD